MTKLKSTLFHLEQRNALHVYRVQELYVATNIEFFNLNCQSEYVIYLLEYTLCKMQYVGKAETACNLRLNNHRKDTKKSNSILVCKHSQEQEHNFNKHTKFIIIDKLVNVHGSKEALQEMLLVRKSFWIQKLKTLVPFGVNQELSK